MNPVTNIHDIETGETITREMTDDEYAWFQANSHNTAFEEDTPE